MNTILQAFLFFLPAGIANMAPVFANKIPLLNLWNTPIDMGMTYKGARLLGNNKRWRGLAFGTFCAGLSAGLLKLAWPSLLPFSSLTSAIIAGCALGFGALVGDALESFFKRQRGVAPGRSYFPFDQIDYILGGLVFIYPLARPSLKIMFIVLVMFFLLHLASSYVGFKLKLKDQPI